MAMTTLLRRWCRPDTVLGVPRALTSGVRWKTNDRRGRKAHGLVKGSTAPPQRSTQKPDSLNTGKLDKLVEALRLGTATPTSEPLADPSGWPNDPTSPADRPGPPVRGPAPFSPSAEGGQRDVLAEVKALHRTLREGLREQTAAALRQAQALERVAAALEALPSLMGTAQNPMNRSVKRPPPVYERPRGPPTAPPPPRGNDPFFRPPEPLTPAPDAMLDQLLHPSPRGGPPQAVTETPSQSTSKYETPALSTSTTAPGHHTGTDEATADAEAPPRREPPQALLVRLSKAEKGYTLDTQKLEEKFRLYGPVRDIVVKGKFAVVKMQSPEALAQALDNLQGTTLDGAEMQLTAVFTEMP